MSLDKRKDWNNLSHQDKIMILADVPVDQILVDYRLADKPDSAFRELIGRELRLWEPANTLSFKTAGKPPTKDVVLGAWRDLERSEALLELIDNSIDEWQRRRRNFPNKVSSELNIYIDIDNETHQLTYEDNAGGVSVDKLEHLVVPGFSDTTDLSPTIGSYKTGGKKAVFRLAIAAKIATRYWNPAETTDEAVAIQLDPDWINDPNRYDFRYAELKNKGVLEKGQTRYVLQLREEPIGGPPWFEVPDNIKTITRDIRQTYTLLLIRNPKIHLYFIDRTKPLEPLDNLYDFSGTYEGGIDIRPQQLSFEVELEHEARKHLVRIEVVLGCRTNSGVHEGRSWGIDLYGNDRLFVEYDQNTFAHLLPTGNSRSLIRGFVNIVGPNVFVPWDTHKRHLNVDREIIHILTKNKVIQELFANWKQAYNAISSSGQVTKIIRTPLADPIDYSLHDLRIPHRANIVLDPKQKRNVSLGTSIFKPKVSDKKVKNDIIKVHFSLASSEARLLASYFGVEGDLHVAATATELGVSIKEDLLRKARRSKGKR